MQGTEKRTSLSLGSSWLPWQTLLSIPSTHVDDAAGKLTVKTDGTRVTVVVDGRHVFAAVKSLNELKARGTVTYEVMGSQDVARTVINK